MISPQRCDFQMNGLAYDSPSTIDNDRTCFSRRHEKNKCSDSMPKSASNVCTSAGPIYYGCEQRK